MRREELALRMIHACTDVIMAEEELAALDARLGDGDLGETMVTVASVVSQAVVSSEGGIQEMLDDVARAVMRLDGAAAPLWHAWLDGLQEAAPDGSEASVDELKAMVARATSDLLKATSAREGDKTMMDAFVAAGEAAATCEGDELDLLDDIADAAEAGAEATKDQVAKYGPARNLGEASRGIADPGAVAVAHFLRGLSRA